MTLTSLAFPALRRTAVALALLLAVLAAEADNLPSYYPPEGFQRTGLIDAVIAEEQRIVVNDMSFLLADTAIVHTPNAFSVPKSRLRSGLRIAYRLGGGRQIVEIWMLPRDYPERRAR